MITGSDSIRSNDPGTWPWIFYVWIAFAIASMLPAAWKWLQRKRAEEWPVTDGRIDSAIISKPGSSLLSKRTPYRAQLSFSYDCAGERHHGFYQRDCFSEAEAESFIRDLEGRTVTIHYNPASVSSSAILEPQIQALLQDRPPSEVTANYNTAESLLEWNEAFLWLLAGLSCIGLILSLWIHVGALMGKRVAPEFFFWGLHVGAIVICIPAFLISKQLVGSVDGRNFWKVILRGSPDWLRYLVYGFFGYAFLNFALFMMQAPTGKQAGANPPAIVWRGFSGHWMVFYCAAFAILYSAIYSKRSHGCLPNGEPIHPYPERCARCGNWPSECHCFTLQ